MFIFINGDIMAIVNKFNKYFFRTNYLGVESHIHTLHKHTHYTTHTYTQTHTHTHQVPLTGKPKKLRRLGTQRSF